MYIKGLTQCLGNRSSINVTHHHHHYFWEVTPHSVSAIVQTAFVLDYPFKDVYILQDRSRVSLKGRGKTCFPMRIIKRLSLCRIKIGQIC